MEVTNPIHKPCPDMAGMVNPDPKKRERSIYLLDKLRDKHGIGRSKPKKVRPLQYVCTASECLG
ncbi:hypothetical protein BCU70_11745 [Vibrio sp. 10N.286.49.C2]|uniref:hypothetical protein n=1 Tax=unclassified Vibrio TaxID=2614977 RepID=UPI000C8296DC|nr:MULTISPECIES: hypothetical protein [unclassified Vibrio]PMH40205.1 hypothetical protein BCU70_11745 [Vibrio sp. 10N.286.49.C2]PMH46342.1 hypothetical protein BCU66_01345 [Vibrio sp. 10N.286.49.B1]PMH82014.1 hypothetical protein BCU58_19480 [Vibrio sp. 10N.286.48.B7]